MSDKHTPVPWHLVLSDNATPHINHEYGDKYTDCGDLSSRVLVMPAEIVGKYNSFENARFIVKACNHHAELVEALRAIRDDGMDAAMCKVAAQGALAKLETEK